MPGNEKRIKHLEFTQLTITRMAANSFFLKAWAVTLIAALLALTAKGTSRVYLAIALIPTGAFWILDGYYLHQEKLYRALYDEVRQTSENKINFSLNATSFSKWSNSWLRSIFTKTLIVFYGIMIAVLIVILLTQRHHA